MDGSPMCKNKRTDSKIIKSKKNRLHVKMIHQVTQLQMQSIEEQNNKYFISSHKIYHNYKCKVLMKKSKSISFFLTKCTICTIKRIHLKGTVLGVCRHRHSLLL